MHSGSPLIDILKNYEAASNRHDIEACVAFFTPAGSILMNGQSYQGAEALRAAHEYDAGSDTQVRFSDFEVEGQVVRCTFWNEHELSRALETGGLAGKAEFTFEGEQISQFNSLPPDETERQRMMGRIGPALRWLREHHPELIARWSGFDRAAGEAIFQLAERWREHRQSGHSES